VRQVGDPPRHVIAIAASAGGVEALRAIVADLPEDLDAAVCVVLHIPSTGRSLLAPILDRAGPLRTVLAQQGERLEAGTIYVAPADRHLLIRRDTIELTREPKENGVRPAADPMFRSLAWAWGSHGIAVVLSGALDDGAAGAAAVHQAGGRVVVQDPLDALVPGMPTSTIAAVRPEAVAPVHEVGALLVRLLATPGSRNGTHRPPAMEDVPAQLQGPASGFTCPECSGALWEVREGELARFRCRVGHAYSEEAMAEAQGNTVEAALWAALKVLEERSELLQRIADRMPDSEPRFRQGAAEAEERAAVIRRVLAMGEPETVIG